jgi:hypothetical protein
MRYARPVPLVFAVLLAGCSAGAGTGDSQRSGALATGDVLADAASLGGIVVDDSQAPVAGAAVGLIEPHLSVVTDTGGAFRFGNLAPGVYTLQAARVGFESAAKRIELHANDEARVTITMLPLAVQVPYHDSIGPFKGYFECQIGTAAGFISPCTGDVLHGQDLNGIVFPGDKRKLVYNLSSDSWQTMVGEARWTQTSYATSSGMAVYPSYLKRATSHWWCEASGRSPIQFRLEKKLDSVCTSTSRNTDPQPSMKVNPLILQADPGFGGTSTDNPPVRLIYQQHFELFMTVFYGEPAPAKYSGFPDS